MQAKADIRAARESDQAVKQLQAQASKIKIEERKVERKRVAEGKKEGLKSKVIILRMERIRVIVSQAILVVAIVIVVLLISFSNYIVM